MHGYPEYCTSSCDTVWAPKPGSSRLEWSDLRVFLAIAREGTLGAAARKLGQTQPTMGRRLRALEAAVGHTLFQRTASGFVLTDEGNAVLSAAERGGGVSQQQSRSAGALVRERCRTCGAPPTIGRCDPRDRCARHRRIAARARLLRRLPPRPPSLVANARAAGPNHRSAGEMNSSRAPVRPRRRIYSKR